MTTSTVTKSSLMTRTLKMKKRTHGLFRFPSMADRVGAETPFILALFRFSRQVYHETMSLFYRNTDFVLDSNGGDSIKFLRQIASCGVREYQIPIPHKRFIDVR